MGRKETKDGRNGESGNKVDASAGRDLKGGVYIADSQLRMWPFVGLVPRPGNLHLFIYLFQCKKKKHMKRRLAACPRQTTRPIDIND